MWSSSPRGASRAWILVAAVVAWSGAARAQQQVQFCSLLVYQGMAEEEGEVGRAGGVRNGIAPGEAASIENALGEGVRGR